MLVNSGELDGVRLLSRSAGVFMVGLDRATVLALDADSDAGDLDESTMAGIVAQNRAVELWTDPSPPTNNRARVAVAVGVVLLLIFAAVAADQVFRRKSA